MRELPLRRRQLHVRLVTDVGEKPQDPPSIGKRKALCQLALASPKTSAPAGWTAPSRKIVKTKPAGLPKVEKLSKRSRLAFLKSKNCQNRSGSAASARKKVFWPPAGQPAQKKKFQPAPAGRPTREKKFFSHRLAGQPKKKSFSATGWPANPRKKVFWSPAALPASQKKCKPTAAGQPARKKKFWGDWPDSPRKKDNF